VRSPVSIWFEREGREGLEERQQGSFTTEDTEGHRGKAEKMVWQGREASVACPRLGEGMEE
jgi:hypothetical protein